MEEFFASLYVSFAQLYGWSPGEVDEIRFVDLWNIIDKLKKDKKKIDVYTPKYRK